MSDSCEHIYNPETTRCTKCWARLRDGWEESNTPMSAFIQDFAEYLEKVAEAVKRFPKRYGIKT